MPGGLKCLKPAGMSCSEASSVPDVLSRLVSPDVRLSISGGTGWLGLAFLSDLSSALGDRLGDQVLVFGSRARSVELADGRIVAARAWNLADVADFGTTHVLHLAALTRDRLPAIGTADFIRTNESLTASAEQALRLPTVRGLLHTSSGAAVRAPAGATAAADPYGVLKRVEETALARAGAEVRKPVVTCRVWSVSGAQMSKPDLLALGSLIQAAQGGEPIVVRSARAVWRRYVDAGELLTVGLAALLSGESVTFDSGGPLVEVGGLADCVRQTLNPALEIRRPERDSGCDDYWSRSNATEQLAQRFGVRLSPLAEQIRRTARTIAPRSGGGEPDGTVGS